MNILRALFGFIRRHYIAAPIVAAVVVIAAVSILKPGTDPDTALTVLRGSISETVSVTGQLKPVQSVDLSFQSSGRVTEVPVEVGDVVLPGYVLAVISNAENNARLRDAQATLLAQQAKLNELRSGARPEDIAAAEADLARDEEDLRSYLDNVPDVLLNAYTNATNAVRVLLNDIFEQGGTLDNPVYTMTFGCAGVCNSQRYEAQDLRAREESELNDWRELMDQLSDNDTDRLSALATARNYTETARDLLTLLDIILSSPAVALEEDDLQTYRESVNTAQSYIADALGDLNDQMQIIATQRHIVQRTASELALKRAGSTAEAIAAQGAAVLSAQAQVDQIRAVIEKNIIKSPIAGTVTRVDAKVGQSASTNEVLVSVVSVSELEMTANVPEVDIGKVMIGNRIEFTVDALQGETFTAAVSYIDPAETVIDGVVNYQIKAMLPPDGSRLKSGLTVNMDIKTQHRENTLILPQYAIIQNDEGTFVEKLEGDSTVRVAVQLGLRSNDGMVELLSGVSEGERVANVGLK